MAGHRLCVRSREPYVSSLLWSFPAVLLGLEVTELLGLLDGTLGDALRARLGAFYHAAVLGGADLPRDLPVQSVQICLDLSQQLLCELNTIKAHLVAVGDGSGLVARLGDDVGGVALRLEESVAHDVV